MQRESEEIRKYSKKMVLFKCREAFQALGRSSSKNLDKKCFKLFED
jgi:hypothetical protein